METSSTTPIHILGAGPAGLAAAYTLAKYDRRVVVSERSKVPGGVSGSFTHDGFILDYGPHFLSRGAERGAALFDEILGPDLVDVTGKVGMFWRKTLLRYPPDPMEIMKTVGPLESAEIIASFARAKVRASDEPRSYADRTRAEFGSRIFEMILRPQVEKLWGEPCERISAAWQPARVRQTSLTGVLKRTFVDRGRLGWLKHPRLGNGQLYDKMSDFLARKGQPVRYQNELVRIEHDGRRIRTLVFSDLQTGVEERTEPNHVLSSLPISVLLQKLSPAAPAEVMAALRGLRFRSTVLVYFILDDGNVFPHQCIYIIDREFELGRITNYANWSPDMRPSPSQTAISCEYWADVGDPVWQRSDAEHIEKARADLDAVGLVNTRLIRDAFVRRVVASHPVVGQETKASLETVGNYLGRFENLQTMGRGGAFRYQDQDAVLEQGIDAAERYLGRSS